MIKYFRAIKKTGIWSINEGSDQTLEGVQVEQTFDQIIWGSSNKTENFSNILGLWLNISEQSNIKQRFNQIKLIFYQILQGDQIKQRFDQIFQGD